MTLRSLSLALAISGILTAAAGAQTERPNGGFVPTGKGWGVPDPGLEKRGGHKPPPPPRTNGIDYHNGPVMLGTVKVYLIWYGNWSHDTAPDILTDEAQSIGGTPWYNMNTTYYSGTGRKLQHVSNSVALAGSTSDSYSHGNSLNDDDVFGIVADAIDSGRLPKDANGVYFVLTSPDVDEISGLCTQYCGWHSFGKIGTTFVKFSLVGGLARCSSGCTPLRLLSPNDNIGADAMASVFAHELSETVTDPIFTGWYSNKDGEEDADKCTGSFGTTYKTRNGAMANTQWGSRDFMIQDLWVNASGGYCGQTYP